MQKGLTLVMKFNKKLPTLFLDPHSEYGIVLSKVNIVLSPSLYWVKKVSLPVKHERDAKKLLPSLFEDILPEDNYSYYVYKTGEEFLIFAYSDKIIIDTLAQKNISLSNISNIYFAQSEIKEIDSALKINEMQSIYKKDDLLILVPCCWIEEKGTLDLETIEHTKHSITLAQFGHIVDNKSVYKIGAILMILILMLGVELFIASQKVSDITASKEAIFTKYKLKATMFQNKAMLKKYKSVHSSQSNLRDSISKVLSLKLKGEEKISLISLKNKKLIINFLGVKKGSEAHITSALKSKGLILKSSFIKETLKVEASL